MEKKKEYVRLTDKRLCLPDGVFLSPKSKEEYRKVKEVIHNTNFVSIYNRLAELEDKIEQGKLREVSSDILLLQGTETQERLVDLFVDFDESGFVPTNLIPNPEEYAREWKQKVIYLVQQILVESCSERVCSKQGCEV